jgi:hypothetical protein
MNILVNPVAFDNLLAICTSKLVTYCGPALYEEYTCFRGFLRQLTCNKETEHISNTVTSITVLPE